MIRVLTVTFCLLVFGCNQNSERSKIEEAESFIIPYKLNFSFGNNRNFKIDNSGIHFKESNPPQIDEYNILSGEKKSTIVKNLDSWDMMISKDKETYLFTKYEIFILEGDSAIEFFQIPEKFMFMLSENNKPLSSKNYIISQIWSMPDSSENNLEEYMNRAVNEKQLILIHKATKVARYELNFPSNKVYQKPYRKFKGSEYYVNYSITPNEEHLIVNFPFENRITKYKIDNFKDSITQVFKSPIEDFKKKNVQISNDSKNYHAQLSQFEQIHTAGDNIYLVLTEGLEADDQQFMSQLDKSWHLLRFSKDLKLLGNLYFSDYYPSDIMIGKDSLIIQKRTNDKNKTVVHLFDI